MSKTIKLQLLTDSNDNNGFCDIYLTTESITGFYIPEKKEDYEAINIVHDGGISTILSEKHVIDYLFDTFVVDCIK